MIHVWYTKHKALLKLLFVWIFFLSLSTGFFFVVKHLGKSVSWIEIIFIIFGLIVLGFLLWQVYKTDNDLLRHEKEIEMRKRLL